MNAFCFSAVTVIALFCDCQVNTCIYPFVVEFLGNKIRGSILFFLCLTVFCPIIVTQIGVSMKESWYEVSRYYVG